MSLVKGIINTVESRNQGAEPMMNISSLGKMRFFLSCVAFRLTFTKRKYSLFHSSLTGGREEQREAVGSSQECVAHRGRAELKAGLPDPHIARSVE